MLEGLPPATQSKSEINRAGARLRDWWDLPTPTARLAALHSSEGELLADAFITLLQFRAGFQAPLNEVTTGLRSLTNGDPVGQRVKREPQILRKLSRQPGMNLARMQDVGGCRTIAGGGKTAVDAVLARIRARWEVKGFKDYVAEPAPSGYRAIHVVVLRDGHLIEIQLRTPRQHAWAEAVERTGFRLRLPLKDGEGPPELLRYFRVAAAGLALEEAGQEADARFLAEFADARERARPYLERR